MTWRVMVVRVSMGARHGYLASDAKQNREKGCKPGAGKDKRGKKNLV